jgi:hypothetical protein
VLLMGKVSGSHASAFEGSDALVLFEESRAVVALPQLRGPSTALGMSLPKVKG